MTHEIVKFNSGFYGIKVCSTGQIWQADLIPWDGVKGTGGYTYDVENGGGFKYYIDAKNTVYYTRANDNECMIWCPGSQLFAHCHHLQQIKARQ